MKNLSLYVITLFLFACGTSDDADSPPDDNSTFDISIVANSTVSIDETIMITVTGNEPLKSVQVFRDNVDSGISFNDNQSTTAKFNYSFDAVGDRVFTIKATNLNDVVRTSTVRVTVNRGNTIKINTVKVLSFYNIDQTWDPEFSDTNPNRLADVKFAFTKPKIYIFNDNYGSFLWYLSAVKENQGDLTWDVSGENLYINPNFILRFSIADDDGEFGQDLMLGPPSERAIDLSQYIATRPSTITLSVPEINLEAVLTVEWPN